MHPISGARLRQLNSLGGDKIQEQLRTHSIFKMTLQFERKYSTQGSGAPCHVFFGFFSGFCGIILPELQIDPQPESTTQPKARGLLHMECDFAIALPYKFRLQDNTSIVEDLQERNSRTLGNYSRRLQDYLRISWSTLQPRDALSILEDFRLVVLETIQLDYSKQSFSTTKYSGACHMDLPGPTTSVGTRTDYSVGPWDHPACATQHLIA
jgi:hypothetical protein